MTGPLVRATFKVRPVDEGWSPSFCGPVVRSALGRAVHDLGCMRGCPGRCEQGPGCAWFDVFGGGESAWRLDASGLDGPVARLEPRPLVLVTWWPDALGLLAEALALALAQGLGPREERTRFSVYDVAHEPVDLERRAGEIEAGGVLALRTPTWLERDGWARDPNPGVMLEVLAGRWRKAGLATELPRFARDIAAEPLGATFVEGDHWSQAQGREYPVRGWVGRWRVRPTPEQAIWIALAEAVGVGKGTARGQGVLAWEQDGAARR